MFAQPTVLTHPVSRFLAALLAGLLLTACPAAKLYKEGKSFDEAGKEYQAAQKYLAALGENENHAKSAEALAAVAEDAYKEKLALAAGYEEERAFPEALKEYRALDKLLTRLRQYDVVSFEVIRVTDKIEAMANASAEERYQAGETKLAARAWEGAIAEYHAAQGFKAGYKDTKDKVAVAFYSWAEDALKGSEYRDAAFFFVKATESAGIGYKDAAMRSGSIYAALGKHFLTADRCRQSVKDLRVAQKLLGGGKVDTDLAAAEECAVTPVAILPFENPTGTNLAGMALGDTLADQVSAKVRKGASEFVRLVERSALDTILAEQGLSTAGISSGSTSKLRGVRYLLLGKLTQVRVESPKETVTASTETGRERYPCEKKRSDGTTFTGECLVDFLVNYKDHRRVLRIQVAGSMRVIDVKSGEQVATQSLDAVAEDSIHYADNFTSAMGTPVTPVPFNIKGGVEVSDALVKLSEARKSLKDEGELANAVIEKLSSASAKAVLAAVDVEKEAVDPSTLNIRPL